MKTQKFILTLMLAFMTMGITLNASSDPKTTNWQTQVIDYLDYLDLSELESVDAVLIDFMVNENSEIMVVSTSVSQLDSSIKNRLNYKKISSDSFVPYVKYTLPVKFDKI